MFQSALKVELFGAQSVDPSSLHNSPSGSRSPSRSRTRTASNSHPSATSTAPSSPTSSRPVFSFTSPTRKRGGLGERERVLGASGGAGTGLDSPTHERYSTSPIKYESQSMLRSPRKQPRVLSKVPTKVLDAPELAVSGAEGAGDGV